MAIRFRKMAPVADAKIFDLEAQIKKIQAEIDALNAKVEETTPEYERLQADRTGLAYRKSDYFSFGYVEGIRSGIWSPWAVEKLERHDEVYDRLYNDKRNARLAELKGAAQAWRDRIQEYTKASGRRALLTRLTDLDIEKNALQDQMMQTPATSIAGLAAQARAVKEYGSRWWTEQPRDLDIEHDYARMLINNLLALAADFSIRVIPRT